MTEHVAAAPAVAKPWTCPFCPLLCDTFSVESGSQMQSLSLVGSDCPRASAALSRFSGRQRAPAEPGGRPEAVAAPRHAGRPCSLDAAVDAAAAVLAASRLPLFSGLGTDVAGARALYALACETGAISDPAKGAALMTALRPLQDRGGYTTTIAEVRARADLVVCIGGLPSANYPEFFRRCGIGPAGRSDAHVVVLGGQRNGDSRGALAADVGARAEWLSPAGDLFDAVAWLAALIAGPAAPAGAPAELVTLAARLDAASYAVIVYQTPQLPTHGGLIIEAVGRIVAALNRRTRAAALPLGGDDGVGTVNQVYAWLSGLPLRSRAGPAGLEHEPLSFDAARLLADGAVDALLWVASFGTEAPPPASSLPTVVLGHPAFAASAGDAAVFIPVSTPGIGSAGHLFRSDGSVMMPLWPVVDDGLPTVADVVGRLTRAVRARRGEARA